MLLSELLKEEKQKRVYTGHASVAIMNDNLTEHAQKRYPVIPTAIGAIATITVTHVNGDPLVNDLANRKFNRSFTLVEFALTCFEAFALQNGKERELSEIELAEPVFVSERYPTDRDMRIMFGAGHSLVSFISGGLFYPTLKGKNFKRTHPVLREAIYRASSAKFIESLPNTPENLERLLVLCPDSIKRKPKPEPTPEPTPVPAVEAVIEAELLPVAEPVDNPIEATELPILPSEPVDLDNLVEQPEQGVLLTF